MGKGIKMRSALDRKGKVWSVEALQALHDEQGEIPGLVFDHPPCGAQYALCIVTSKTGPTVEPVDVPAYMGS